MQVKKTNLHYDDFSCPLVMRDGFESRTVFQKRETGLEPATNSLEGCDSSHLSYSRVPYQINGLSINPQPLVGVQYIEPDSEFYGEGRIRTSVGIAGRFTVCSRWPLGYLSGAKTNNKIWPLLSRRNAPLVIPSPVFWGEESGLWKGMGLFFGGLQTETICQNRPFSLNLLCYVRTQ